MVKIYSFKICPCYQRISLLLEFLEIPYQSEFVELDKVPRWFVDTSPDLEPYIEISEDKYIVGLNPVIKYLEKTYYDQFASRCYRFEGSYNKWCELANQKYIEQCNMHRGDTVSDMKNKGTLFYKSMGLIEKHLSGKKYFYGDQLSGVDMAWIPILYRAYLMEEKTRHDFFKDYPNIGNWQKNLKQTGLAESSLPDDFEIVFEDFYLHSDTYLGQLYRFVSQIKQDTKETNYTIIDE